MSHRLVPVAAPPTSTPFKFNLLSTELAVEIIRYASTPNFCSTSISIPSRTSAGENPYSTALALCLVSHAVRQAAMPQLLHTVILSSTPRVHAYTRFVRAQRHHRHHRQFLAIDGYARHTKRMWCGGCIEEPMDTPASECEWVDYGALGEVICGSGLEDLCVDEGSLHLLYGALACFPAATMGPRRVTFTGPTWRWKPLTSTPEGCAFLARIKYLTLWFSNPEMHDAPFGAMPRRKGEGRAPKWVGSVPFEMMGCLRGVGLLAAAGREERTEMIVYRLHASPCVLRFHQWVLDDVDPGTPGPIILSLPVETARDTKGRRDVDWGKAWVMGYGIRAR